MSVPATAANTVRTAAANAGNLEAQNAAGDPQASATDVWKHTGEGLTRPMSLGDALMDATPVGAAAGIGRSLASGVHSSSDAAIDTALSQQADQIGKDFDKIGEAKGALQTVGATFAMLTSIEQLITAPLSAIPFPAFPALRITDMDIGLPHAHNHPPNLIPPAPPVPLPSTGPVIPIPYVSGANKVTINGLPAARCGDMGLGIWCGGYVPLFEIFLGSSSVWIEGARAARTLVDVTNHCIFSARKGPDDKPLGPFIGTTITGSGNVVIGGVPVPSLTNAAMGAAFKALFKGLGKVAGLFRRGSGAGVASARSMGATMTSLNRAWRRLTKPRSSMTRNAQQMLDVLPNPGSRVNITDIHITDLADLTRHCGDEFGVGLDRNGMLFVTRGDGPVTHWQAGDIPLAHTHPHPPSGGGRHPGGGGYQPYPRDMGWDPATGTARPGSDIAGEADNIANIGPEYSNTKAVIYENGDVRYFNEHGPSERPPFGDSPIDSNGFIDGPQHLDGP